MLVAMELMCSHGPPDEFPCPRCDGSGRRRTAEVAKEVKKRQQDKINTRKMEVEREERIQREGKVCHSCHGRGHHSGPEGGHGSAECNFCGGRGKVL